MRLTFGDMTREVNVFNLGKQPHNVEDQTFEVNFIENLTSEYIKEFELETDCDLELDYEDFNLDQIRVCCELGIKPYLTKCEANKLDSSFQ